MTIYKKINKLLTSKERKQIFSLLLFLFVGMGFEILGIGVLIPILTAILKPEILLSTPIIKSFFEYLNLSNDREIVSFCLFALIFIYFLKSIYLLLLNFFQNKFNSNLTASLSNRLYQKYMGQPYSFFINRNSSELLKNLQVEVGLFNYFLLSSMVLLTEVILVTAVLISLIYIEPRGTILVVLFFFVFSIIFFQFSKKVSVKWGIEREQNDSSYSRLLLETFGGIKEILLLNRQRFYMKNNIELNKVRANISTKSITLGQVPRYYIEFLSVIALVVFISNLYSQGKDINELIVTLGVFVAATFRILPSINRILSSLQQIKFYESSIDLLYEEFNSLKDNLVLAEGLELENTTPTLPLPFENKIRFEHLYFNYSKNSVLILNDLNLTINKGESIGIIGVTGSGKSTLINILVGLFEPNSGGISVDNSELNKKSILQWRKNIGYVSQNVYLSDTSIMQNIAFGMLPQEISIKRIMEVIEEAQLIELINSLPEGYNTNVGERGTQLSGGQQQRIGIARALYHNPELLILDEATSALDIETEERVMKSVNRLKKKKTIIIVTHRISTLKECDFIHEIKNGKLERVK